MPQLEDLPHLVRLLEDDNPVVREAVGSALAEFGGELPAALESSGVPMGDEQWAQLNALGIQSVDDIFAQGWKRWMENESLTKGDPRRLEEALGLVAARLSGNHNASDQLSTALDELCGEYRQRQEFTNQVASARTLAEYLFSELEFRGDADDYYAPENTDLISVIKRRMGNPISLACLYMLVGSRCGVTITGSNFPGHFLAVVEGDGTTEFVDCFNGGRFLTADELRSAGAADWWTENSECPVETIVMRCLLNLANAYNRAGDQQQSEYYDSLARQLR